MKSLTFTCDHCGAVVGIHDQSCRSCGKTFQAVRCPRCHHQGQPSAFVQGCPQCGYLAPAPSAPRRSRQRDSGSMFGPGMAVVVVLLLLAVGLAWFLRKG